MERRTRIAVGSMAGALVAVVVVFGRAPTAGSPVRVPTDDDEVVEVLPLAADDSRRGEIASLRGTLARDPTNVSVAVQLAQLHIRLARERSDPRHLGHAQAVLAPWWHAPDAPVRVLVLRATIEQSLHDFDGALAVLERVLAHAPSDAQAWLTRATILTVLGRYEEARESCARVGALGAGLASVVCETQIDSLTSRAGSALERLDAALAAAVAKGASRDEEAWARSSMAEYAARTGKLDRAEALFRRALELDPRDAYTRGAYADLLLDRGRHDDVIALLEGQESYDALLLRLAIAESRAKLPAAAAHVATLRARFDASRERGDTVHRREEARFWLELGGDERRALSLARANWDVQKEPADARILLEAALAAGAPAEAAEVVAFVDRSGLEDPAVRRAIARLDLPRKRMP